MLSNFNQYFKDKAGLKDSEFEQLQTCYQGKAVNKGEYLLRAGGVCKHSIFVESGLLRMYSIDPNGKEHIVQFAPENWLISDRSSVFFNLSSEYFIDVIEDSRIVLLEEDFINRAVQLNSSFQAYHERLLQNHIRHLQKRIHSLLGASAEDRYIEFVRLYPDLLLRVPQWMIASYLGITPESLSRVRRDLAKKNFVKY